MIYNNNFVKEELSKSLMATSKNKFRIVLYALFIAIISFALSSACQVLEDTVASSMLGRYASNNGFSITSIAQVVVLIYISFYIYANYKDMTFADIKSNRIYMLRKLGIRSGKIITFKMLSAIILPIILYLTTVLFCLLLCYIVNYPIDVYDIGVNVVMGSLKLLAASLTIVFLSTFFQHKRFSVLIYASLILFNMILQHMTGFARITENASTITFSNIFGIKCYFYGFIILAYDVSIFVYTIIVTHKLMQYYFKRQAKFENVICLNYESQTIIKEPKDRKKFYDKLYFGIVYSLVGILFLLGIGTDFALLFMTKSKLETTVEVGTHVNVLFNDDSMEKPMGEDSIENSQYIYKNDMAIFEVLSLEDEIKVGDIVYFLGDSDKCVVERVYAIEDNIYYTDVINYPVGYSNSLGEELMRNQIMGKLVKTDRYLGAWVKFNQSVPGRIIFLGVPTVVVCFYDQIKKLVLAYSSIDGTADLPQIKKVKSS
ncbi:MAG: hypothetical protein HUJ61_04145 [Bacilli bacterium]|nr:hypothetical protein [Bacilli bacterium]